METNVKRIVTESPAIDPWRLLTNGRANDRFEFEAYRLEYQRASRNNRSGQ
jgi:hypothetical protein